MFSCNRPAHQPAVIVRSILFLPFSVLVLPAPPTNLFQRDQSRPSLLPPEQETTAQATPQADMAPVPLTRGSSIAELMSPSVPVAPPGPVPASILESPETQWMSSPGVVNTPTGTLRLTPVQITKDAQVSLVLHCLSCYHSDCSTTWHLVLICVKAWLLCVVVLHS